MEIVWIILLICLTIEIYCDKKKNKKTCPGSNYAQLSDTCYYFYYDTKSWWDAQQFCEGKGGTLLIFQERKEIKLIKKELKKIAKKLDDTSRFWLGLKHNEDDNEFYWADGSGLARKRWESKLDDKVTTPGNCVVIQAKENSGAGAKRWETKPCTERMPYVCEIDLSTSRWTLWGKWNDCSVSCGRGTRKRFRKCLQPTSASSPCVGSKANTGLCNEGTCPVVQWSKWSSWGSCSVTCGSGIQTRSRSCSGSSCSGRSRDTKKCTKLDCPEWSQWSKWGGCSVTCGTGKKQRTRRCMNSNDKKDCQGNDKQIEKCSLGVYPEWSNWSDWGGCSVTCGTGQKQRTRRCLNSKNNKDCKGNNKESERCSQTECPVWSNWSEFGGCSVTCGTGQKQRTRRCMNSKNNKDCKGNNKETERCSLATCPEWSNWSDWGGCSVTCGTGQKQRTRRCLNSKNNKDCQGNNKESERCSKTACPVWSNWSDWGGCSVTCGTGQKQRTRRCLNSKNNKDCKGNNKETEKCSLATCPEWSRWSDWTGCSVTCGEGTLTRSRTCLNSKKKHDCEGKSEESKSCSQAKCLVTEWSNWSDWTSCSVTCGEGTITRSRTCLNSKRKNDCKGKSQEKQLCVEPECPEKWTTWSEWSQCSVTCGNGKTMRNRQCLVDKCQGKTENIKKCTQRKCPDEKKSKKKKRRMRNRVISARKTKNKGIVGYEIVKTIADRAVKCALYCLRYDSCRSFNYEFRKKSKKKTDKDNRICILNTVSLTDQPSALEAMPGFRLYDMGQFFDSD